MALILSNRCNWWHVYNVLVYMMIYQISKVCLSFMYMQHKHMVYGKLHIHHYLFLDQNVSDNSYSAPLRHEVWNLDHKMVIMVIDLCCNTFSHLCVKHHNYPEHDTFCLSILFSWIFFCICPDQWHHFCLCYFVRLFWNSLAKLTSYFSVPVCIWICESNLIDPGSLTVDIN